MKYFLDKCSKVIGNSVSGCLANGIFCKEVMLLMAGYVTN